MKHTLLSISLLFFAAWSFAQPLNKATYSTMISTAEEALANKDYYNALDQYNQAYDERKDKDLIPIIADLHFKLRDYKRAENYYKRVFRKYRGKDPEVDPQIRYNYAIVLKTMGQYDEAIEHLQKVLAESTDDKLKDLAELQITGAEMGKVLRPVPRLRVENAGNNVNTSFSEYSAFLTEDGKEMYYASFQRDDVIILEGKEEENRYATILKSSKSDKGWGDPTELDDRINRPGYHTANITLSPDGRTMYFTRQQMTGNEVSESNIFYSDLTGTDYTAAKEVVGVNGNWIAKHPAIGELFGKEVMFFVSDMQGGEGGFDIYYATYKGNGVFADPVNLGPKINTAADEVTPFYRDGTLYFSSNGHPGIGGYDIFSSIWNGTTWSEPKNMGLGYNSQLDDRYFMIDKEGYHGVLLSNREGTRSTHSKTCCDDIYEFTIEKIELDAIVGTFNAESGEPLLNASVQLFELTDNQMTPIDEQSNEKGNVFAFPLLLNKSYMAIATAEGFYPDTSEVFNTVGFKESKKLEHRLRLRPMPPEPEYEDIEVTINEPIRLNNIYYDFDDDKILPDAENDLNDLKNLMDEYPAIKIELSSHTDAQGKDAYNQELSQRRANSAKAWLVEHGVAEERIVPKGYGETQILNQCVNGVTCTDDEHRFNRRTEFKIIEGPTTIMMKRTEKKLKEGEKVQLKPQKSTTPEKQRRRN
ncbi:MAG: OmpA family protein [Saprospiraceae bacterium]